MARPSREALAAFFRPRNVALVGASDRSAWSLSVFARFGEYRHDGQLFAVNRNGTEAHGLKGYRSVAEIPAKVDTAFIYVPAAAVTGALREAAAAGVTNAVVLSSGFAEAGEGGAALQAELAAAAAERGVTLLGPNSLGFANFADRCFCTSIRTRLPVRPGRLAIVSQSGAVAGELAKWGYAQGLGLSFLCATGNEAQLGVADVVDYLVDDPATAAIALYVEGISDPERFMAAAGRARAAAKPIVMLKLGRSPIADAVAQAHTGSLVGDDRVTDAMCRRFGVTRVSSIEELVTTADFLGKVGPIDPPRIGMASISGGACGMYADLAQIHGLATPPYAPETQAGLRAVLPDFAATLNPLDVTGVAVQTPGIWAEAIPVLLKDPGMGLIVACNNLPNTAEELKNLGANFQAIVEGYRRAGRPPVILSLSVQDMHQVQAEVRRDLGLDITLPNIELGVRALAHLQRWSEILLSQPPSVPAPAQPPARRPVTERETLDHLAAHGVPVIAAKVATSAEEAAAIAEAFAGPVVLKVLSPDIAHKTEAGGVRLNVQGAEAARRAYQEIVAAVSAHAPAARIEGVIVSPMRSGGVELIVGFARDPQWGPVIVAGLGGVFTEALKDSQVRLLPVTPADVRGMLQELRGASLLQGFRGAPPADLEKLAKTIAAIGDAALALGPDLAALEVNPLRVLGEEIECLDGLAIYRGEQAPA
jgi:acyl-CoA synthetase (NDP forming)